MCYMWNRKVVRIRGILLSPFIDMTLFSTRYSYNFHPDHCFSARAYLLCVMVANSLLQGCQDACPNIKAEHSSTGAELVKEEQVSSLGIKCPIFLWPAKGLKPLQKLPIDTSPNNKAISDCQLDLMAMPATSWHFDCGTHELCRPALWPAVPNT
jgi:hypothetical protein